MAQILGTFAYGTCLSDHCPPHVRHICFVPNRGRSVGWTPHVRHICLCRKANHQRVRGAELRGFAWGLGGAAQFAGGLGGVAPQFAEGPGGAAPRNGRGSGGAAFRQSRRLWGCSFPAWPGCGGRLPMVSQLVRGARAGGMQGVQEALPLELRRDRGAQLSGIAEGPGGAAPRYCREFGGPQAPQWHDPLNNFNNNNYDR